MAVGRGWNRKLARLVLTTDRMLSELVVGSKFWPKCALDTRLIIVIHGPIHRMMSCARCPYFLNGL